MTRPWQIGIAFIVCLVVAFGAMAWVSVRAIRIDRQEARAQRQVEVEEEVRLALGRMDTLITPLIAQENARPYFVYRPFYAPQRAYTEMFAPIEYSKILVPSPLLTFESDQVLLHFQIDPTGEVTSPQAPRSNMRDVAEAHFPETNIHERITAAEKRLAELAAQIDRDRLIALVPPPRTADEAVDRQLALVQSQQDELPNTYPNFNEPGAQAANTSQQRGVSRSAAEYRVRNAQQQAAQWEQVKQKLQSNTGGPLTDVLEGVMRPVWIGNDTLLLARRVSVNGDEYVQGVWLNWPTMRDWLLAEATAVFPDAALERVVDRDDDETAGRMLASVPARLTIDDEAVLAAIAPDPSGIRTVLIIAWVCMLLAAVAVGVLLVGALALSERRGAFVSAVTHELRTPLTTFRMYTEMLERGMVRDEAKRSRYLNTMRTEADRLSHLVENVLAYARLERGSAASRATNVKVGALIEGVRERLTQRAEQAGMELSIEPNGEVETQVKADPAAVEQVLFNLVDNACKYAASASDRHIHVEAHRLNGCVQLRVRDHGPGIDSADARKLFKPFHKSARDAAHSAPGVGLGLALSRRLAAAMGGDLHIQSCDGGACFELTLPVAQEDAG